jgi:hypothetical protein
MTKYKSIGEEVGRRRMEQKYVNDCLGMTPMSDMVTEIEELMICGHQAIDKIIEKQDEAFYSSENTSYIYTQLSAIRCELGILIAKISKLVEGEEIMPTHQGAEELLTKEFDFVAWHETFGRREALAFPDAECTCSACHLYYTALRRK